MTKVDENFKVVQGSAARFVGLLGLVKQWGDDRGIYYNNGATITGQIIKLVEEANEISKAAAFGTKEELIDGIGDCLVVLVQICRLSAIPLDVALMAAWEDIKDRKGQLCQGIFVKQDDIEALLSRGIRLSEIESPEELESELQKLKGVV